jgi:hypothetical protein
MRGAVAAACAAVLMGLAPPAALACTSLAAAGCAAEQDAAYVCGRRAEAECAGGAASAPRSLHRSAERGRATPRRERATPWRAPSGPAPSQAPPARA